MIDTRLAILHGSACAATILFAAHVRSPAQRQGAITASLIFCACFGICLTGWTDWGRQQAAQIGLTVKSVWALLDALFGIAAVLAGLGRWWGWVLWGTVIVSEVLHGLRMLEVLGPLVYSDGLQWVLWGQVLVFVVIGGPGVVDRAADFYRRAIGDRLRRRTLSPENRP